MRIGILTHPLHFNYGGIMQCYALSNILQKQGHEVFVLDRQTNQAPLWKRAIIAVFKALGIKRFMSPTAHKSELIIPFVVKNISRTQQIRSDKQIRKIAKRLKLNAVIVGSDQVWRQDFAMQFGYNYFLDFVGNDVLKVSYAASFGLSDWKYDKEQTMHIKQYLSHFRSISVRESEAIKLCKVNLGLDVKQVLDPTLLFKANDYTVVSSPRLIDDPYAFVYWLGDKAGMDKAVSMYTNENPIKVVSVNLRDNSLLPSVEDWISYFRFADVVLTDSFHGCAFSIVFQRDLRVYPNESGGLGRIKSLFSEIGINGTSISRRDYNSIEHKLESLRDSSLSFLNEALSK